MLEIRVWHNRAASGYREAQPAIIVDQPPVFLERQQRDSRKASLAGDGKCLVNERMSDTSATVLGKDREHINMDAVGCERIKQAKGLENASTVSRNGIVRVDFIERCRGKEIGCPEYLSG